jgi:hypothetical protein
MFAYLVPEGRHVYRSRASTIPKLGRSEMLLMKTLVFSEHFAPLELRPMKLLTFL